MPVPRWNEEGRIWEDDTGLLSEEQIAKCARADVAETFRSPVPTRQVSNGEYMPSPQTGEQKRVEARIKELAGSASKKLGVSRRKFLASTGGMAAAFLAMNEVFGRFFNVSPAEMFEPEAFAATGVPQNLFVFDDQLHFVRGSRNQPRSLRAVAQGPGPASTAGGFPRNPFNPLGLLDEQGSPWTPWNEELARTQAPNVGSAFHLVQFIKDVFLDSQVTIGLISNVTASLVDVPGEPRRPPKNVEEAIAAETLTAEQTAAARNFINGIAGSTRCMAHGLLYVGEGNLDYIQYQTDNYEPDSWKGYNISNAAKVDRDPESLMRRWRHDDEAVAYPTFELISKNYGKLKNRRPGYNNICVHKGLSTAEPVTPEIGHPADMPKAARDWPNLNFITYHSCIRPGFFTRAALDDINSGRLREGVPDILWTTEYAQLVAPFPNCYAEIGTTWASTVITFPTVAAHILGQLMKFLGANRIVFGSDSVWYGSPQWQIEALWRFQIPADMRRKYGYPELTEAAKRKILGLNSARLYGVPGAAEPADRGRYRPVPENYEEMMSDELKTLVELPVLTGDNLSRLKEKYVAMGPEPSNTRYGWIRTKA